MKIAFLGKGGSGKSTLAHHMCLYMATRDFFVLAVDADHNMDLAYSLNPNFNGPFLGGSREDMLKYSENEFKLNPADPFTKKYAASINSRIKLMVSGLHTEDVLEGKRCSHSLSSSLKKYFPKLKLNKKEAVIVDEKAGSDGAGTGVLKGFNHCFVISEPTFHGVKSAHQIADILEYYKIPYSFVANKIPAAQKIEFRKSPIWKFPLNPRVREWERGLETLESIVRS